MSQEGLSSTAILSFIRKVLGLSAEEAEGGALTPEALLRRTRQQLLACARYLRLTGVHRLTKSALVERLQQTLRGLGYLPSETDEPLDRAHRFALGRPADGAARVEHIPWGYGQDRVTAMVVDPENLYAYWEMTDAAIERARASLGGAGQDAGLVLRIYDVTNRIFDGTNAHGFFDQRLERTDRQWFMFIGKPTSTAIVELGLASADGSFVRIARSNRVDFPRREPASGRPVEWLTVHAQTGEVGDPTPGAAPPATAALAPASPSEQPVHHWDIRFTHGPEGEWRQLGEAQWQEWLRTIEWHGPLVETSWEAGPFPFPVDAVRCVEERHAGGVSVQSIGATTRIVYGPWQVIIRGLGARAERHVLAVWEIRRAWASRRSAVGETALASGRWEELALGASEMRLGGASEIYRLGASEFRYAGASEILYAGASERRLGGASERLYAGASEHAGRRRE